MMRLVVLLTALAASVSAVNPRQTSNSVGKCLVPELRREWRQLATVEKLAYLAAEKCLFQRPAKLNKFPGAKTRYDELVALHQIMALQIHSTGQFLPYHRYYVKVHQALLKECGYYGTMPWWDETIEAQSPTGFTGATAFLNPDTGFGPNGDLDPLGCVSSGPFADVKVNIGPGYQHAERCVSRAVNNNFSSLLTPAVVATSLDYDNYGDMWRDVYSKPHFWGHGAFLFMGNSFGTGGDPIVSPGDPLFHLHHGWVDRLWWQWQERDRSKRLKDMSGPNTIDPVTGFFEFFPLLGNLTMQLNVFGHPTPEILALAPNPRDGDPGNVTTLNHVLTSLGVIPDARIKDVMDTTGGYLCYTFT